MGRQVLTYSLNKESVQLYKKPLEERKFCAQLSRAVSSSRGFTFTQRTRAERRKKEGGD